MLSEPFPEIEGKCQRCKINDAKHRFAQSTMDAIHGGTELICTECLKKQLRATTENATKALKELEKGGATDGN